MSAPVESVRTMGAARLAAAVLAVGLWATAPGSASAGDRILSARIAADGSIVAGKGVRRVIAPVDIPGSYGLIFGRDVTQCRYSVTSGTFNMDAEIQPLSSNPKGVYVNMHRDGTQDFWDDAPGGFNVIVLCQN